jgi:hypothetical protein
MRQFLFCSLLFIAACSNNNTPEPKTTSSTTENNGGPSAGAVQGNDLVGEWELVGFVMDTNDNLQVDEDERKTMKTPGYKDYMTLNQDGSGQFTVAQMEGRYEAKAKDGTDKKTLTWFDKGNGAHPLGTIVSVSKDELHLKEPGGHGLMIWKRL